ncbi:uncharacterized protein BO66DRAFT_80760 [Aspergillus aculeatinus CBS 121060]|uniref:Uncharacterized protein n=1 Tax=Aspergillus aculeatinus CBS 121060 TaxID=1448322 RepID=A0ACD1HAF0_9EURO|nr:hypothetical protein BO66DRAFT_80760 [Aspergillus aculeatinus CBS 121060]RAH70776.1 hypothetical protein BO66DRAFT_80760 [Aspergillus aculeatinus CBS 121060]
MDYYFYCQVTEYYCYCAQTVVLGPDGGSFGSFSCPFPFPVPFSTFPSPSFSSLPLVRLLLAQLAWLLCPAAVVVFLLCFTTLLPLLILYYTLCSSLYPLRSCSFPPFPYLSSTPFIIPLSTDFLFSAWVHRNYSVLFWYESRCCDPIHWFVPGRDRVHSPESGQLSFSYTRNNLDPSPSLGLPTTYLVVFFQVAFPLTLSRSFYYLSSRALCSSLTFSFTSTTYFT